MRHPSNTALYINADKLAQKHNTLHRCTYVAPTVVSLRKAGVNWYRTKRPAFGSISSFSSSAVSSSSPETQEKRVSECVSE